MTRFSYSFQWLFYLIVGVFHGIPVSAQENSSSMANQSTSAVAAMRQKLAAPQAVLVSGMKDQDWKPYRDMLRGLVAFETHHRLAPDTELKFVLRPQSSEIEMASLRLRLVGEHVSQSINLTAEGVFTLPQDQRAADENADLVLNQKKNLLMWNVLAIRTPTLQTHQRRLGDLRLTCEVFMAMEDWDELKKRYRLRGTDSGNACESPRLSWTFYEPQRIKNATIKSATRWGNLALSEDKRGFVVYLFDLAWSDHALIDLEFEQEK
jgi:hypothetical protein